MLGSEQMLHTEKNDLLKELYILAKSKGRPEDRIILKYWWDALEKFDLEIIIQALDIAGQKTGNFPAPEEIANICRQLKPKHGQIYVNLNQEKSPEVKALYKKLEHALSKRREGYDESRHIQEALSVIENRLRGGCDKPIGKN